MVRQIYNIKSTENQVHHAFGSEGINPRLRYLINTGPERPGTGNPPFTESSNKARRCAFVRHFHHRLLPDLSGISFMPRVLVIDDQSDVRTMISIVLRINQFEIVEAATAEAGLKAFEQAGFDLAIVDIFLQGSNGSDLIATMRERVPDLPVIAISGMTALDFLSKSPELADVVCLQKPFRPNDLIRAIEAAREATRPSASAVARAAAL